MELPEHADVVLVGGGVASARCARTLRRHGFDGSILLIGDEPVPPYNRPPLSKELLRDDLPDDLVLAEPAGWYARRDVVLASGRSVAALEPAERRVRLDDGSAVSYERCLLATGAEPRRLSLPGAEHVRTYRTLADARSLRATATPLRPGARATIVGGGFIGIELASSLAALGMRPTIVEIGGELWSGSMGAELSGWALERLAEAGIEVRLGTAIEAVASDAATAASEEIPHDLIVAGIGVIPRTGLAADAGLAVDDGILTDAEQRASVEGIWAAGDVARVEGRRVEHWHAAREAGERAALSMLGQPVPAPRASWVFTEVAGTPLDIVGDATEWDEVRWLAEDRILAYLRGEAVVQVVVVASAMDPGQARELVERGASVHEFETMGVG